MEDLLAEISDYLVSPNEAVRLQAAQNIAGLSTNADALAVYRAPQSKVIPRLKTLCLDALPIAHEAFKALINITAETAAGTDSMDEEFVCNIIKLITHKKFALADLACMLLSNITKSPRIARLVLQDKEDSESSLQGLYLLQLLEVFLHGKAHNPAANFDFLASVFANISVIKECREFLLDESRHYPLHKMLSSLDHENLYRRGGVITTIKNCCFSVELHDALLDEDKIDILPHVLLPLAGPEELSDDDMDGMPDALQLLEPEKTREPNAGLRLELLNILLMLTTTVAGRQIMRRRKVYPIIREMHLAETDERCDEVAHELVQMLLRKEVFEAEQEADVVELAGSVTDQ